MRNVRFKPFRVSSNTNSFGLRGVWIISFSGRVFEIALSHLAMDYIKEKGEVILPVDKQGDILSTMYFSFELPEKKPRCPRDVRRKIWNSEVVVG
jgi:hypothetical protein